MSELVLRLHELWDAFERRLKVIDGATRDTIYSYKNTFNLFMEYLEENSVENISTEAVEEFLLWLGDRGYSPNSIKRHFYALKKFLCYVGYCDQVEWSSIRPRGQEKYDYIILSEEEVRKIIDAGFEIKPMYGLMLWTGYEAALRVSELVGLRVRQVDLNRRAVLKYPVKREQPCEAPISDDLAAHLEEWIRSQKLSPEDYVFKTKFGRKWDRSVFHRHVFLRAAERAGLLEKYPKLRYHDFARHTRATLLLKKGVDIYTVNRILCHRLLQTTLIYLHLAQAEELRRRIEVGA